VPDAPEISVVVPTYDRPGRLKALLAALQLQTLEPDRFEVVVVDNGSADGTAAVLEEESHPGLRVVRRDVNRGPTVARNDGWKAARGSIVAFTDDDCEPSPQWLEAILDAFVKRPVAIVQGRTEPNPKELSRRGIFSRTVEVREEGPYFPTCNLALPRALLERLDGFDETYFFGGEDTDLAWRAMEAGASSVFAERALVHHAVNELGPLGKLRVALRWSHAMQVFARHPRLRRELPYGIFWKESHALLVLALLGVALAHYFRPAILLALPYARQVRARCISDGVSTAYSPYLLVHDAVETYAAVRGAVRYRVPVV
jgi:GT2 family glycosyltransferase